jgi:hypothetical protein
LKAFYSEPVDQGGWGSKGGAVTLVDGHFPGDPAVQSAVGRGYDLIISKNTLKHGYIHPDRPADKRMLIDLGVDDATFLKALYDDLNPGGYVMIYNLCPAPAPADKPFIPWADGRSPFSREQWLAAGFKIVEFDKNDDEVARQMGHILGWDAGTPPDDLNTDLFCHYTLMRKPGG